jgi:predicted RNA-binding protein with PUA-like domain
MASFLFKTEPGEYAFADLERERRTVWSGIRNPTALIHLRTVRKGDQVVIYHSGKDRAAVGIAVAESDPYPDPKLGDPKRVVLDLVPVRALARPVAIAKFRADPVLKQTELIRITRLSVMPLTAAQFDRVLELAKARTK